MKARLLFLVTLCTINVALADATLSPLQAALKSRMDLAKAVAGGEMTADAALLRMKKAEGTPSRQALGVDADFGEEALAMGHHLLGMNRPDAAEIFFRAAEDSFARASQAARDNRTKADYLAKLATIRASYLGKARQAEADIDEAIRLQPADKSLAQRRAFLARDRAEAFKAAKK